MPLRVYVCMCYLFTLGPLSNAVAVSSSGAQASSMTSRGNVWHSPAEDGFAPGPARLPPTTTMDAVVH